MSGPPIVGSGLFVDETTRGYVGNLEAKPCDINATQDPEVPGRTVDRRRPDPSPFAEDKAIPKQAYGSCLRMLLPPLLVGSLAFGMPTSTEDQAEADERGGCINDDGSRKPDCEGKPLQVLGIDYLTFIFALITLACYLCYLSSQKSADPLQYMKKMVDDPLVLGEYIYNMVAFDPRTGRAGPFNTGGEEFGIGEGGSKGYVEHKPREDAAASYLQRNPIKCYNGNNQDEKKRGSGASDADDFNNFAQQNPSPLEIRVTASHSSGGDPPTTTTTFEATFPLTWDEYRENSVFRAKSKNEIQSLVRGWADPASAPVTSSAGMQADSSYSIKGRPILELDSKFIVSDGGDGSLRALMAHMQQVHGKRDSSVQITLNVPKLLPGGENGYKTVNPARDPHTFCLSQACHIGDFAGGLQKLLLSPSAFWAFACAGLALPYHWWFERQTASLKLDFEKVFTKVRLLDGTGPNQPGQPSGLRAP